MILLVLFTMVTLVVAALFHFYWAFAGERFLDYVIPTKNEKALFTPAKIVTLAVGISLFGFAFVAYALYFNPSISMQFPNAFHVIGWVLTGVFALRVMGDFNAVGIFKTIKTTRFAAYDSKFFIPLTLCWSVTFGWESYNFIV